MCVRREGGGVICGADKIPIDNCDVAELKVITNDIIDITDKE